MAGLTDLAVDALATHRITRLVVEDTILDDVRDALIKKFPPSEHKIGFGITCPHCVSVWAGGAVTVMRLASENPESRRFGVFRCTLGILRYSLALSGAVSLGHEVAGKLPTQF